MKEMRRDEKRSKDNKLTKLAKFAKDSKTKPRLTDSELARRVLTKNV